MEYANLKLFFKLEMGTCAMGKPEAKNDEVGRSECDKEFYPLYMLKQELLEKMGFQDDHPYKIFCSWRFKDSIRREAIFKKNINKYR